MISRRLFLSVTGAAGLPLLGLSLLAGCAEDESAARLPTPPPKAPLPDDPTKPWWLRREYAPVEPSEAHDLEVVGALPPTLNGLYLRNGPNPLHDDSQHWFLGDGMVHGLLLQAGKAPWYRARYIQTAV